MPGRPGVLFDESVGASDIDVLYLYSDRSFSNNTYQLWRGQHSIEVLSHRLQNWSKAVGVDASLSRLLTPKGNPKSQRVN